MCSVWWRACKGTVRAKIIYCHVVPNMCMWLSFYMLVLARSTQWTDKQSAKSWSAKACSLIELTDRTLKWDQCGHIIWGEMCWETGDSLKAWGYRIEWQNCVMSLDTVGRGANSPLVIGMRCWRCCSSQSSSLFWIGSSINSLVSNERRED